MFVHSFCYVVAERFDLLANVFEEGVTRPAPDHHYCENGYLVEVHCHGTPRSNRVSAKISFLDAEGFPSDGFCCCVDGVDDLF